MSFRPYLLPTSLSLSLASPSLLTLFYRVALELTACISLSSPQPIRLHSLYLFPLASLFWYSHFPLHKTQPLPLSQSVFHHVTTSHFHLFLQILYPSFSLAKTKISAHVESKYRRALNEYRKANGEIQIKQTTNEHTQLQEHDKINQVYLILYFSTRMLVLYKIYSNFINYG